jgi:hypothetical protein
MINQLEQYEKSNKRPRTIADFFMVSLSSMRNLTSALGHAAQAYHKDLVEYIGKM